MSFHLTTEAGILDFPLGFNRIISKPEDVDFENLPVKIGDAVAITSVLQLHSLLVTDDKN
ncbi:putative transcription factor GRAS family [Medicago truncatula]|uniref:Putative transcription factor GRAS family n=1 Tax=Medicago truncatula TaxID=3880 RepID=A0A396IMY6_MEDTR|nr:putative transcription factor GRAS family [Medicago truncatula]